VKHLPGRPARRLDRPGPGTEDGSYCQAIALRVDQYTEHLQVLACSSSLSEHAEAGLPVEESARLGKTAGELMTQRDSTAAQDA